MPVPQRDNLRVVTYRERTTGTFTTRKNGKFIVIDSDLSIVSDWGTNDEIEISKVKASGDATVRNITDGDTTVRVTIVRRNPFSKL